MYIPIIVVDTRGREGGVIWLTGGLCDFLKGEAPPEEEEGKKIFETEGSSPIGNSCHLSR